MVRHSELARGTRAAYSGAVKPRLSLDRDSRTKSPATKTLPPTLARELERELGSAGFIQDRERLLAYESDALTRVRGTPLAVLIPGTRRELRFSVRRLYEAGIPFVPRGMGTGLTGGAVATRTVVISTARLDRFLRLDADERLAIVEPGVITEEISRRAAPTGLRYLPDPGSASACTIGGNVATNAGGPHCLRHGVTADHLLGLEVLLASGREYALDRGESGGLDLAGLFTGSEGTFGIVTTVTVRLEPVARARRTALVLFDSIGDAGLAVTEILGAGILPVALEIIDRTTIRVVEESPFAAGLPTDAGAALVVECEGGPEEADEEMAASLTAVRLAGARDVQTAATEAERERLWQARKKAFGALGRLGPDVLIEDAVVPRTALPDLLTRIEAVAAKHELPLANFFHAGDGNLHPNIVFDVTDSDQVDRVESARREILEMCIETGGTITGEHGVGLDKLESMPRVFGRAELSTLHAIRHAFDSKDRCNPGKAVPAAHGNGATVEPPSSPPTGAREDRLHALIAARPPDSLLAATGAESTTSAGEAREAYPSIHLVSTAGLSEVVEHRRDDLTISVGAGARASALLADLAADGQWIPLEGRALDLSVGGLIAAAPPGAFDARYGPIRRQLLAVRAISVSGALHRWGRPVMKNVAGYDLVRLYCGSFGRLGAILEATFRLWPLPAQSVRLVGRGPAARELLEGLVSKGELTAADGTRWTRSIDQSGHVDEITLWLLGSRRSVAARTDVMWKAASLAGCELEELSGIWDLPLPEKRPTRDGRSSLRISTSLNDFFTLSDRVSGTLAAREASLVGLPGSKILLVEFQRNQAEVPDLLDALLGACEGAAVALERGSPEEHESVDHRRPAGVQELEASIVAACGGQPRCWQADYV